MSSSRQRMFAWSLALVSILLLSVVSVSGSSNAATPPRSTEPGARATVGTLQTQIADAEGSITALLTATRRSRRQVARSGAQRVMPFV